MSENTSPNEVITPDTEDSDDSDLSKEPRIIEKEGKEFVTHNVQVQEEMLDRNKWYSHSKSYWQTVPSTVDGMLGGYGDLTFADLQSSAQFLAPLCKLNNTKLAIDCGAGIGRITKGLLLNIYDNVEMLDTCQEHLDQAKDYMGDKLFSRVSAQHCLGLEDFQPTPNTYDLVWIQWVIIYLSDYDFISLLKRFQKSLTPDGYIVVKDNVCRSGTILDDKDNSVTRSDFQLKQIFKKAGLDILIDTYQKNFPKDLFKVKYYALR